MKKHIIFASLLFGLLSIVTFLYAQTSLRISTLNGTRQTARAAWYQASLKKGNHLIEVRDANLKSYDSLQSLASDSSLIVIGIPQQSVTELVPPKEILIRTKYQVAVTDVFKGNVDNQGIIVEVPGGIINFGNGTSAEMQMPQGWKSPQSGARYVFFLTRKENNYALVGGPQGAFELTNGDVIDPQAIDGSSLVRNYKGRPIQLFVDELRTLK